MTRVFLARRVDGLGERLKAMLNAMVLAELTGGKFIFQWRQLSKTDAPFHDIVPPNEMFDERFLAEHYRPEVNEDIQPLSHYSEDILRGRPGAGEVIQIEQNVFGAELKGAQKVFNLDRIFSRAFRNIRFTPDLEGARELAHSISVPGSTPAVHLRAGDIVYGWHRFTGRFVNKLYPYPVGLWIINGCNQRDIVPIVFGQDAEFIEWLREAYRIRVATDFLEEKQFTSLQHALFDICLMAKCSEIYAGTSGFPAVAARVSNSRIIQPHDVGTSADRRMIIADCLSNGPTDYRISKLQRALAIWALLELSQGEIKAEEELRLINLASAYDPPNPIYALHEADILYRENEEERAEQRLFRHLQDGSDAQKIFLKQMLYRPIDGKVLVSPYLRSFQFAAAKGYPLAAYCIALSERVLKPPSEVHVAAQRFLELRPSTLQYLDKHIVEAAALPMPVE